MSASARIRLSLEPVQGKPATTPACRAGLKAKPRIKIVHRVRKFVGVGSGRLGYAMTAAALSEVSNGAKWNSDLSFNVADAILADPEFEWS